jgi:hypothetical protein
MNGRHAAIVALVIVTGCGGTATPAGPTAPPPVVSPAGNWSGTISDAVSGDGEFRLSLEAFVPDVLSGTWSATLRSGSNVAGPAVARLVPFNGYAITMYVDAPPPCATGSASGASALLGYTLVDLVISSGRLTGRLARLSCSGVSLGAITLLEE